MSTDSGLKNSCLRDQVMNALTGFVGTGMRDAQIVPDVTAKKLRISLGACDKVRQAGLTSISHVSGQANRSQMNAAHHQTDSSVTNASTQTPAIIFVCICSALTMLVPGLMFT